MKTFLRNLLPVLAVGAMLALAGAARSEDVTFTYEPGDDGVTSVSIRGSFNDWGETAMTEKDGAWSVVLDLDPGEYQYKYFVNGEWPGNMETDLGGGPLDPAADGYVDDGYGGQNAVRIVGGAAKKPTLEPAPELKDGYARIRYHRPRGGYAGWGLHVWEDTEESVEWASPLPPTGEDDYGLYWDIRLTDGAKKVGFIIHKGDSKDPGPDMFLELDRHGREVWIVSGRQEMFTEEPDISALALGDLSRLQAHWVEAGTVAWRAPKEGHRYFLHSTSEGSLELTPAGVTGGEAVELTPTGARLGAAAGVRFPHLRGLSAYALPADAVARVDGLVRGQVAFSAVDPEGKLVEATGVQLPGVLDDAFAYDGPLGVTWDGGVPTFRVWAPTARVVRLHIYETCESPEPLFVLAMDEEKGVWSSPGRPDWNGMYYLYEVDVYMHQTGAFEINMVTDPYSRGLSMNSARSLIVNLDDPATKPEGWDGLGKPALDAPEDIVLYELHVRDFSASDATVPDELVGTFKAFTAESNGTAHLRGLAEAGVTHVHLLPSFDIATVNEDKSAWQYPPDLSVYPPDSEEQQAAIARIKDEDPYNWGYDPYHYGVPEGSYATDPNGVTRIVEFREMVAALSEMGLRVVMDVVYNHTHASGPEPRAVLDRIVPGYYHRLSNDGRVETSTCCQNTATEHAMMRKLMVDDLVHWASDYKVDGFRFDLMGHHMKRDMEEARDALHALTVEADGVDGSAIYLYGEGWDFGEVQGGQRGVNATQQNMAGTGIGCFNDRIRDAVRGGSAFSDRREQGFATGLYTDPSGYNRAGGEERGRLLNAMDRIRVGLAGNLRGYPFTDHRGQRTTGGRFESVGFAADPQEAVCYVSAHDNETFFDKVQYAAPRAATVEDRLRMQMMGLSVVSVAQGVPFFHAGSEILRSKSMEADSYNAGDWFNKLDWSYQSNNFGVGLPSAEKNRDRWNIIGPILAREDIVPGEEHISAMQKHFEEMLRVRGSSPLFRLRTADDVIARVRFHNTGAGQVPGLIVMSISDTGEGLPDLDPSVDEIVVVLNATPDAVAHGGDAWQGLGFDLHPVLQGSADETVRAASYDGDRGTFNVPARTTAVFVR